MVEIVERRTVYSTPWCELVAKTTVAGEEPFYSLKMLDYVCVLALTAAEEVLLVRQYRPAVEAFSLELPAGHVEAGEEPEAAARRELLEETGYTADAFEPLGCLLPDTGRLGNRQWGFFAAGAHPQPQPPEREEGIELKVCPLEEFRRLLTSADFNHALHLAVVLLALAKGKLAPLGRGW